MSNTSEYKSEGESSQGSSEYHSGQESEPDKTQIILVNREKEFTFLNIHFPMPSPYPHPYIQLENALAEEWLEIQLQYGRYLVPDKVPITLMDCIL